jgi:hypothetical protein
MAQSWAPLGTSSRWIAGIPTKHRYGIWDFPFLQKLRFADHMLWNIDSVRRPPLTIW